ncbi:DUF4350 domain-containing protein [Luteimicrobium subarcticum]|uniref:Uncharacterized protein DUF4350 n=1 Tax=Luteimicrobium subarcticum TaxID=620910 RepID=A0A2M8WTK4_9MICO|nr:DUF4350 domain-containing protein [Luteimicrobium subarcticum]PJI94283.1 uncharacterized protein DUF4350 [Luteimicrobium subarcticum]
MTAPPTRTPAGVGSGVGSGSGVGTHSGAPTVRTTSGPVRGDGTTTRSRAARRWRRVGWVVALLALLGVVALILALVTSPGSKLPLAPDSTQPRGAKALAQVLEAQGVDVHYTRDADEAAQLAGPGTTLLVVPGLTWDSLDDDQLRALAATRADVALVAPDDATLAAFVPELDDAYGYDPLGAGPSCDDPDARAAGTVSDQGGGYVASGSSSDRTVTLCFPVDTADVGSYAVVQGATRVAVYDDARLFTNRDVAQAGNAALALRMLGRHHDLVWLLPDDRAQASGDAGPAAASVLPTWCWALLGWSLVVVLVLALWRGRRLGPLVPEDLPVVVRAAETTRGRARLYRAGRTRGHAAAGLRARTAQRLATRLGLPRGTEPVGLVTAVARATGRPAPDVHDLLYGPPPTTDDALLALARRLDDLESEVHP